MPESINQSSPSWDALSGCLHRKNEGLLGKLDLYSRRFSLLLETKRFYTTNRVIDFVENKLTGDSDPKVKLQAYEWANDVFNKSDIALSKKQQERVKDVLNVGQGIANSLSTPNTSKPTKPAQGDIGALKQSLLDLKKELEEYDKKVAPPEEEVNLENSVMVQQLNEFHLVDAARVQAKNVKAFQKDKKEDAPFESFLSASVLKEFEEEAKKQEKFMDQLKLTVEYEKSLANDFDIQRVIPDGNCFFYSLAHQVKEGVTEENLFEKMIEVRYDVTQYMKQHAQTYQMLSGREGADFDNYLSGMEAVNGSWGTGLEAYAASNLYGRTIRLHIPPTPGAPASEGRPERRPSEALIQEINPDQPVEQKLPPVVLLYNGANHWDWLKPKRSVENPII